MPKKPAKKTHKVRLTRFIENTNLRIRLQRTIKIPVQPQVGWIIEGYTTKPTIRLIVETIAWNGRDGLLECILGTTTIDVDDNDLRAYAKEYYGNKWKTDQVALNIKTLDAMLNSRQDELVPANGQH